MSHSISVRDVLLSTHNICSGWVHANCVLVLSAMCTYSCKYGFVNLRVEDGLGDSDE